MIEFPNISPDIFSVELFGMTFALRWYALAYIAGLLLGWWLITKAVKTARLWAPGQAPMTTEQVERLLTWVILGVIIGGRLGYVLFYQPFRYLSPENFAADPMAALRLWDGGMSFHGGFMGVVVAGLIFARREKLPALSVGDLFAYAVTPGLLFGRLANFINAELWGRQTDLSWGVIFPGEAAQTCPGIIGACARHPSQLYEAGLEGLLLGLVLFWLAFRARSAFHRPGLIAGTFFAGYGLARFMVEFVRQPDAQFITLDNPLGLYLHLNGYGLTAGQLLSLPMILAGAYFIVKARHATAHPA